MKKKEHSQPRHIAMQRCTRVNFSYRFLCLPTNFQQCTSLRTCVGQERPNDGTLWRFCSGKLLFWTTCGTLGRTVAFCCFKAPGSVTIFSDVFSHFVWGKIMAATMIDRGNSWASRTAHPGPPLNDDRAPIVAKAKQFFKLSLQLGGQVVVLSFAYWWTHYPPPNCGLEGFSRHQRSHRPSRDLFRRVVSGVWLFFVSFFFFVGITIVASPDGQQDVQCFEVQLLVDTDCLFAND